MDFSLWWIHLWQILIGSCSVFSPCILLNTNDKLLCTKSEAGVNFCQISTKILITCDFYLELTYNEVCSSQLLSVSQGSVPSQWSNYIYRDPTKPETDSSYFFFHWNKQAELSFSKLNLYFEVLCTVCTVGLSKLVSCLEWVSIKIVVSTLGFVSFSFLSVAMRI